MARITVVDENKKKKVKGRNCCHQTDLKKKNRPDPALMKEPTILLSRLHLIVLKLKQTQESSRDCVGNMHFWVLSQGIGSIFYTNNLVSSLGVYGEALN